MNRFQRAGLTMFVAVHASFTLCQSGWAMDVVPTEEGAWHLTALSARPHLDYQDSIAYADYSGRIVCFDADSLGTRWSFDTGAFVFDLRTADFDGDGQDEILAAGAQGTVFVLNADGKLRWKYETRMPLYQTVLARPAGEPLVLVGGVAGKLYVFDSGGELLFTQQKKNAIRLLGTGDLDGDGQDEVIAASFVGPVEALSGASLRQMWATRMRPMKDGKSAKRGAWRPYSLTVGDLNQDGRSELVFGGSFYDHNAIHVLDATGRLLWDRSEGLDGNASRGGDMTRTVFIPDRGRAGTKILGHNGGRIAVYNGRGGFETGAASDQSFADICLRTTSHSERELWLASAPNGDTGVYRLPLDASWKTAFANLPEHGRIAEIRKNLRVIKEQLRKLPIATLEQPVQTIHVVSGGSPDTPQRLRSQFSVWNFYRKRYPYRGMQFALNLGYRQIEPIPGYPGPDRSSGRGTLNKKAIVDLLRLCEREGVPFFLVVGHGCTPFIDLETARNVLKACPTTCLGFSCSENEDYGDRLAHYLDEYWLPLLDTCKDRDKRAIMIEKSAWWAVIPSMRRFQKLSDGAYADVLVPSVEDSNSRCPELNLAGRLGLFVTGAVRTFSARTIGDEPTWSRQWQYEAVLSGHPFLRRQVEQAALGARVFEYRIGQTNVGGPDSGLSRVGDESVDILLHLLGKGVLVPPTADALCGLSPVGVALQEPSEEVLRDAFDRTRFANGPLLQNRPLVGLGAHWGWSPTMPSYISTVLFGQDRYGAGQIPKTPYGMVVLAPQGLARPCRAVKQWMVVPDDGQSREEGESQATAWSETFVRDYEVARRDRLFKVDGDVFWSSQRVAPNHFRMTLIDPGYMNPQKRVARVTWRRNEAMRLVDVLSRETIAPDEPMRWHFSVPAGAFRIIELFPAEEAPVLD